MASWSPRLGWIPESQDHECQAFFRHMVLLLWKSLVCKFQSMWQSRRWSECAWTHLYRLSLVSSLRSVAGHNKTWAFSGRFQPGSGLTQRRQRAFHSQRFLFPVVHRGISQAAAIQQGNAQPSLCFREQLPSECHQAEPDWQAKHPILHHKKHISVSYLRKATIDSAKYRNGSEEKQYSLGRFPLCASPSTSLLYSARSLLASVALNLPTKYSS